MQALRNTGRKAGRDDFDPMDPVGFSLPILPSEQRRSRKREEPHSDVQLPKTDSHPFGFSFFSSGMHSAYEPTSVIISLGMLSCAVEQPIG